MCTYNTIGSHTDHFEIQKKGFRRKSIDFCKSVSQKYNVLFEYQTDVIQIRTYILLVLIRSGSKLLAKVISRQKLLLARKGFIW